MLSRCQNTSTPPSVHNNGAKLIEPIETATGARRKPSHLKNHVVTGTDCPATVATRQRPHRSPSTSERPAHICPTDVRQRWQKSMFTTVRQSAVRWGALARCIVDTVGQLLLICPMHCNPRSIKKQSEPPGAYRTGFRESHGRETRCLRRCG